MPISTIVQNAGVTWDFTGFFPLPLAADVFPLVSHGLPGGRYAQGVGQGVINNQYAWPDALTATAVAANYAMRCPTGGTPYFAIYTAGAGYGMVSLAAFRSQVDNGTGFDLAPGAQWSSWNRVHWIKFLIQSSIAAPDQRNGLLMTPRNASVHAWPDQIAGVNNSGGFGITGDGAGQWQYASYNRVGAFGLREAVALPAHVLTEWNAVDILIIGDRVGQAAVMEFWFNGVLIATRNWLGVLLEAQVANEWGYVPIMAGGSVAVAAGECCFASITCRRGAFNSLGVAV